MIHVYDSSQFPHSVDDMNYQILCKSMRLPMTFVNKASLIAVVDHDDVHLLKTRYLSGNSIHKLRHLPLIIELHMLHTPIERRNEILEDFGRSEIPNIVDSMLKRLSNSDKSKK